MAHAIPVPRTSHPEGLSTGFPSLLFLEIPNTEFSFRNQAEKDTAPEAVFFLKGGDALAILTPRITFKIAGKGLGVATTGFISSVSRPEVKTAAVSGWMPNPMKGPGVLDNVKYFQLVQDFAQFLEFRLEPSYRDNNGKPLLEHRGRFVASHVFSAILTTIIRKKKVAVFWIIAALKAILGTTDFTRLRDLRYAHIPAPWLEAVILLDHKPCNNVSSHSVGCLPRSYKHPNWRQCLAFLRVIRRATGIDISVRACRFLVEGHRKGAEGCHNCLCNRCRARFGVGQQEEGGSQVSQAEDGSAGSEGSVIGPTPTASSSPDGELVVAGTSHQGGESGQADLQPARGRGVASVSPLVSSGPPEVSTRNTL
ncbi:hypothetical protein C8A05DRAFT_11753 [Staphylotrichum tortipilum]|uniref:Single-strand DNA deaminase toxin A-like C-terminal domain-containing protein n=1 Tax=Staphylotrichum tortipilum TaxID=2831512 RepID=A0AAN6RXK7_9PEZI|nr:hypothetical protein C8A05DRAFT_11753 [Staphylotrichum longicolle]